MLAESDDIQTLVRALLTNGVALFNHNNQVTGTNSVPNIHLNLCNFACFVSIDVVFHFHSLKNDNRLTRCDLLTNFDMNFDNCSLHRRSYSTRPGN